MYWTISVLFACCHIHIRIAERETEDATAIPIPSQGSSLAQLHTKQLSIERRRWNEAVVEAGLDPATVSDFGRAVPKFSASMVNAMASLRALGKKHRFNFQGRLMGSSMFSKGIAEWERRRWTVDFARANFAEQDFFLATDAKTRFHEWSPLGAFDRSIEDDEYKPLNVFSGRKHKTNFEGSKLFDEGGLQQVLEKVDTQLYDLTYYAEMAASNFTLCPGGDTAWSMRAYESAVAGAICVIRDPKEDWNPSTSKVYTPHDRVHLDKLFSMYKYLLLEDTPVFSQEVADENFRTFIKYQTFMEGDNTPEETTPHLERNRTDAYGLYNGFVP